MAKLNITQAAKRAGIGRNTLYDHMKKGKVSYEVGDSGKKLIDTSELERVYSTEQNRRTVEKRSEERPIEHDRTLEIEQLLHQQIKALEHQVEDLHQERDKLLGIVEKQTLMLEDKREKPEEPEKTKTRPEWLYNPIVVYPVAIGGALLFALLIVRFAADFLLSALLP